MVVEGVDVITADIRLVDASKLQADESALTGESAPVGKRVAPLAAETPLTERANILFKGTAVTRGSADGVVVGTGMATELGRISSLVEEAKEQRTPLEKRLDRLGHRLIGLTLVVGATVAVAGIVAGKGILLMVPELAGVLKLELPGAGGWALILGFSALPLIAGLTLQRGAAHIDGRLKATRGSAGGRVPERRQ